MIYIFIGKSGAGKDTALSELINRKMLTKIVSDTTRPMREGETNGVEYNFISENEFLANRDAGKYLEHRIFHRTDGSYYYGGPKIGREYLTKNWGVILDPDGAKEYIKTYGRSNCRVIMIVAAEHVRRQRAELRGSFVEDEWKRRAEDDNLRFSRETVEPIVDFYITNTGGAAGMIDNVIKILNGEMPTNYARFPICVLQCTTVSEEIPCNIFVDENDTTEVRRYLQDKLPEINHDEYTFLNDWIDDDDEINMF